MDFSSLPPIADVQEYLVDDNIGNNTTLQILSPMTPKKPKKKKEAPSPRSEKVDRISKSFIESALIPAPRATDKDIRAIVRPMVMPANLLSGVEVESKASLTKAIVSLAAVKVHDNVVSKKSRPQKRFKIMEEIPQIDDNAYADHNAAINSLQKEVAAWKIRCYIEVIRTRQARSDTKLIRAEFFRLQAEQSQLRARISTATSDVSERDSMLSNVNRRCEALTSQLEQANQSIENLKKEIIGHMRTIERCKLEEREAVMKTKILQGEVDIIGESYHNNAVTVKTMEHRVEEIAAQLREHQEHEVHLKFEVVMYKKKYHDLQKMQDDYMAAMEAAANAAKEPVPVLSEHEKFMQKIDKLAEEAAQIVAPGSEMKPTERDLYNKALKELSLSMAEKDQEMVKLVQRSNELNVVNEKLQEDACAFEAHMTELRAKITSAEAYAEEVRKQEEALINGRELAMMANEEMRQQKLESYAYVATCVSYLKFLEDLLFSARRTEHQFGVKEDNQDFDSLLNISLMETQRVSHSTDIHEMLNSDNHNGSRSHQNLSTLPNTGFEMHDHANIRYREYLLAPFASTGQLEPLASSGTSAARFRESPSRGRQNVHDEEAGETASIETRVMSLIHHLEEKIKRTEDATLGIQKLQHLDQAISSEVGVIRQENLTLNQQQLENQFAEIEARIEATNDELFLLYKQLNLVKEDVRTGYRKKEVLLQDIEASNKNYHDTAKKASIVQAYKLTDTEQQLKLQLTTDLIGTISARRELLHNLTARANGIHSLLSKLRNGSTMLYDVNGSHIGRVDELSGDGSAFGSKILTSIPIIDSAEFSVLSEAVLPKTGQLFNQQLHAASLGATSILESAFIISGIDTPHLQTETTSPTKPFNRNNLVIDTATREESSPSQLSKSTPFQINPAFVPASPRATTLQMPENIMTQPSPRAFPRTPGRLSQIAAARMKGRRTLTIDTKGDEGEIHLLSVDIAIANIMDDYGISPKLLGLGFVDLEKWHAIEHATAQVTIARIEVETFWVLILKKYECINYFIHRKNEERQNLLKWVEEFYDLCGYVPSRYQKENSEVYEALCMRFLSAERDLILFRNDMQNMIVEYGKRRKVFRFNLSTFSRLMNKKFKGNMLLHLNLPKLKFITDFLSKIHEEDPYEVEHQVSEENIEDLLATSVEIDRANDDALDEDDDHHAGNRFTQPDHDFVAEESSGSAITSSLPVAIDIASHSLIALEDRQVDILDLMPEQNVSLFGGDSEVNISGRFIDEIPGDALLQSQHQFSVLPAAESVDVLVLPTREELSTSLVHELSEERGFNTKGQQTLEQTTAPQIALVDTNAGALVAEPQLFENGADGLNQPSSVEQKKEETLLIPSSNTLFIINTESDFDVGSGPSMLPFDSVDISALMPSQIQHDSTQDFKLPVDSLSYTSDLGRDSSISNEDFRDGSNVMFSLSPDLKSEVSTRAGTSAISSLDFGYSSLLSIDPSTSGTAILLDEASAKLAECAKEERKLQNEYQQAQENVRVAIEQLQAVEFSMHAWEKLILAKRRSSQVSRKTVIAFADSSMDSDRVVLDGLKSDVADMNLELVSLRALEAEALAYLVTKQEELSSLQKEIDRLSQLAAEEKAKFEQEQAFAREQALEQERLRAASAAEDRDSQTPLSREEAERLRINLQSDMTKIEADLARLRNYLESSFPLLVSMKTESTDLKSALAEWTKQFSVVNHRPPTRADIIADRDVRHAIERREVLKTSISTLAEKRESAETLLHKSNGLARRKRAKIEKLLQIEQGIRTHLKSSDSFRARSSKSSGKYKRESSSKERVSSSPLVSKENSNFGAETIGPLSKSTDSYSIPPQDSFAAQSTVGDPTMGSVELRAEPSIDASQSSMPGPEGSIGSQNSGNANLQLSAEAAAEIVRINNDFCQFVAIKLEDPRFQGTEVLTLGYQFMDVEMFSLLPDVDMLQMFGDLQLSIPEKAFLRKIRKDFFTVVPPSVLNFRIDTPAIDNPRDMSDEFIMTPVRTADTIPRHRSHGMLPIAESPTASENFDETNQSNEQVSNPPEYRNYLGDVVSLESAFAEQFICHILVELVDILSENQTQPSAEQLAILAKDFSTRSVAESTGSAEGNVSAGNSIASVDTIESKELPSYDNFVLMISLAPEAYKSNAGPLLAQAEDLSAKMTKLDAFIMSAKQEIERAKVIRDTNRVPANAWFNQFIKRYGRQPNHEDLITADEQSLDAIDNYEAAKILIVKLTKKLEKAAAFRNEGSSQLKLLEADLISLQRKTKPSSSRKQKRDHSPKVDRR